MTAAQTYGGKYRVVRELGRGGMGIVYEAVHEGLGSRVALKKMAADMATPDNVARFLREARAAANLRSPHVARVVDVGTTNAGVPWLVMELLDGEDLATAVARRATLPVDEACRIVSEACSAMAEAHAAGIVHRDLKPANVFLARLPGGGTTVKVLDFGLAKVHASGDGANTASSTVFGTPEHMAPEQLKSAASVDARADVWALGVLLHELLAGEPPFTGPDMRTVITRIFTQPPASLHDLRPDVPERLARVVLSCLEKEPSRRTPDVATLARALVPFLAPKPAPPPSGMTREPRDPDLVPWGTKEWTFAVGACVVMLALGLATARVTAPPAPSAAERPAAPTATPPAAPLLPPIEADPDLEPDPEPTPSPESSANVARPKEPAAVASGARPRPSVRPATVSSVTTKPSAAVPPAKPHDPLDGRR